ncbi:hypothetical protein LXL04_004634 [Taraxacum kok-saghyz]
METQSGRTEQYAGNNTGNDKILETAFKKETVGLVTREGFTFEPKLKKKKKRNFKSYKKKELLLQKLKKRKVKANPKLSFAEEIENGEEEEEEDGEDKNKESNMFGRRGFGKDPTVETSFLPDSEREAEEQAERERLRKQWLREQEQIKNEALEITYSYWDGAGHRRVMQVRKGDTIEEFLRSVQQQLAPEFREIRTTSVDNKNGTDVVYVKEDLIIPHLSEASCEEDNTRSNSSQSGQKQPDPPQLSWKLIKTNMFLHPNRKNQTIDEIMVCHCKPSYDGRMECQDECLNRMLNIECVKGTCPCGDFCSNQQFQKCKYSKLKCFPCGKKGFGLHLKEDIPKGT